MAISESVGILTWALLFLICAGCGKSGGLDKVVVEGTVSYDGKLVENGEIRFRPAEGTLGPVSGAPIVDGYFRAVAKGGVPVGKHIVQIEAYDTSAGGNGEMIGGGRSAVRVNYLPDKYHRASELTLDVPGDNKTFTHDFTLEE